MIDVVDEFVSVVVFELVCVWFGGCFVVLLLLSDVDFLVVDDVIKIL